MFEKAVRMKLRWNYKGVCTVEDLWDLPLKSLDSIFKELNAKHKTQKEESLLSNKSSEDKTLELQIAIVRHIVEVKLAEKEAREQRAEKAEKKQRLLEIIAKKQDEELENKSVE